MRAWKVWAAFAVCVALALVAGRWLRQTVLRVESARLETERRDEIDGLAQRALWRMEYAVVPLLVQEAARPWYHYLPLYSADRPLASIARNVVDRPGVAASPLLDTFVPYTLLHVQIDPHGKVSSPQSPEGEVLIWAQTRFGAGARLATAGERMRRLVAMTKRESLTRAIIQSEDRAVGGTLASSDTPTLLNSILEFRSRRSSVRQAQQLAESNRYEDAASAPAVRPTEMTMRPYWCAGGLFLARHLLIEGRPHVQAVWLDWEAIERRLLDEVRGLLPRASVVPIGDSVGGEDGLRLASLPVRLVPGPVDSKVPRTIAPLRLSLNLAFGGLLVAMLAIAVLLRVILVFTERRAAFVSAVTHELRTPLTALRLVTDLLAEGRVRTEAKRQRSIETLRRESTRLAHLVENVLAYSRIEGRARARERLEEMTVREVLESVRGRAEEHARHAGLALEIDLAGEVGDVPIRCDPAAVERIVFNLVDNASKYASKSLANVGSRGSSGDAEPSATAPADDDRRRIVVGAEVTARRVLVHVRDFGPGIPPAAAARLFRPFSKSVDEAARTQPGVGLGLALCRRLAREMGGDLRFDLTWTDGAGFVLELPRA